MRLRAITLAAICTAWPAAGQQPQLENDTVQVSGRGKVSTMPDVARLTFWNIGEGKSPDEATSEFVSRQKAITGGIAGLLTGRTEITNTDLTVIEARDPKCATDNRPRLSEGDCAVIGYLARGQSDIRTSDLARAGTAVGLASRLGARDARLQGFSISDNRQQRQAALSRAMADAKSQAQALATAAGRKLGTIRNVRDTYYGGEEYAASLQRASPIGYVPPPPPPPPPVEIALNPGPQDTTAQVQVTFALEP